MLALPFLHQLNLPSAVLDQVKASLANFHSEADDEDTAAAEDNKHVSQSSEHVAMQAISMQACT